MVTTDRAGLVGVQRGPPVDALQRTADAGISVHPPAHGDSRGIAHLVLFGVEFQRLVEPIDHVVERRDRGDLDDL